MLRTLYRKLKDENAAMRALAARNGWKFFDHPNPAPVGSFVTTVLYFTNSVRYIYDMQGSAHGKDFDVYAVAGFYDTAKWPMGNPAAAVGAIHYATILRTPIMLSQPANLPKEYFMTQWQGYQYVVYGGNAVNEEQLNKLLDFLS